MPEKARIDAPGALYHIIVRGIERVRIFKDDTDRNDLPDRIGAAGKETKPGAVREPGMSISEFSRRLELSREA